MYKSLKKVVLLCLLVLVFAFSTVLMVACNDEPQKVTYSVKVTVAPDVEGVTLTSLKAQWYAGSTAVSEKIALSAEGKASVELDEGSYTIKLDGVPATATYQEASVTAASPEGSITITKVQGSTDPIQLNPPTNVKVVAGILSWDRVEGAVEYEVYDGGAFFETVDASETELAINLNMRRLSLGLHSFTVKSIGDEESYLSSGESSPAATYEVWETLNAPEDVAISQGILSWSKVDGASGYAIYNGTNKIVDNISQSEHPSYNMSDAQLEKGDYSLTVVALGSASTYYHDSEPSSPAVSYKVAEVLSAPINVAIEGTNLVWSWVEDAISYAIYNGDSDKIADVPVVSGTEKYEYSLSNLAPAHYSLTVVAIGDGENFSNSQKSDPAVTYLVTKTLSAPTNVTIVEGFLSWDAVDDAVEYEVLVDGNWLTNVGADEEILGVNLGMRYIPQGAHVITVKALGDGEVYLDSAESSGANYEVWGTLPAPENVDIDNDTLTWDEVEGATGYVIYNGETELGRVESTVTSYSLAELAPGKYILTVVALGNASAYYHDSEKSEPADEYIVTKTLDAPTNLKVSGTTFSWDLVDNATGYIVYYSASSSAANDILDSNVGKDTHSYSLSNLDPGRYYLRVMAKGDGEVYLNSAKSSTYQTYTYNYDLTTPQNVKVSADGVITWDPVDKATNYKIYLDTEGTALGSSNTTSYQIPFDITKISDGTHTFKVTAAGSNAYYKESEKSAGVSYTLVYPSDFEVGADPFSVANMGEYLIRLTGGKTYTIKINGDFAEHFKVIDTGMGGHTVLKSNQAQSGGDLIVPGETSLAVAFTVPANQGGIYQLRFIDMQFDGHSCFVQIVEGDSSVRFVSSKQIKLDTETTITRYKEDPSKADTFECDLPGIYKFEVISATHDDYTITISSEGRDNILQLSSSNSFGTFVDSTEYVAGDLGSLTYTILTNGGAEDNTLTVKITYVGINDIALTVDGEAVYGAIASTNSTADKENTYDPTTFGKLTFSGLVAGQKYTIVLLQLNNNSGDHKLLYNGVKYDSVTNEVRDGSPYTITFTAAEGVNEARIYSVIESGKLGTYKAQLCTYMEGDDVVTGNGPKQGESKWLITGGSKAGAVELKFSDDFVAGATYTIGITDSAEDDGLKLWFSAQYHLVYGDKDEEIPYASGNTHKEITFVADGSPVKVYSTNMMGNANPVNTKFEILSVVIPEGDGSLNIELNGSVIGSIVEGESNALVINLPLLTHLKTYTLTINVWRSWIGNVKVKYGQSTLSFADVDGSSCSVDFTFSEIVEPNVLSIYLSTNEELSLPDVTFTLTEKAAADGLAVGGSYTIYAGQNEVGMQGGFGPGIGGKDIPLVGVTAGSRYTITLAPSGIADYNRSYWILYNGTEYKCDSGYSATITIVDGQTTFKVVTQNAQLSFDLSMTMTAA